MVELDNKKVIGKLVDLLASQIESGSLGRLLFGADSRFSDSTSAFC